jgi:hypothetical protein
MNDMDCFDNDCPCCCHYDEEPLVMYGPRPEPTEMEKFLARQTLAILKQKFAPMPNRGETISLRRPNVYTVNRDVSLP